MIGRGLEVQDTGAPRPEAQLRDEAAQARFLWAANESGRVRISAIQAAAGQALLSLSRRWQPAPVRTSLFSSSILKISAAVVGGVPSTNIMNIVTSE